MEALVFIAQGRLAFKKIKGKKKANGLGLREIIGTALPLRLLFSPLPLISRHPRVKIWRHFSRCSLFQRERWTAILLRQSRSDRGYSKYFNDNNVFLCITLECILWGGKVCGGGGWQGFSHSCQCGAVALPSLSQQRRIHDLLHLFLICNLCGYLNCGHWETNCQIVCGLRSQYIHPFSSPIRSRVAGQQPKQESPGFPIPSHFFQLPRWGGGGGHEAFHTFRPAERHSPFSVSWVFLLGTSNQRDVPWTPHQGGVREAS